MTENFNNTLIIKSIKLEMKKILKEKKVFNNDCIQFSTLSIIDTSIYVYRYVDTYIYELEIRDLRSTLLFLL